MKTFVDKEFVLQEMKKNNVRIADCRFQLGAPEKGRTSYREGHIPGAVYFHIEEDLAGSVGEHGGRHPLPEVEQFKKVLENAGISNDMTVIAYDGGEGSFAARFWWLLKYVGHEKAFILDGGFKDWVESGYPVDTLVPQYRSANYKIAVQEELLASYEEVKETVATRESVLIDSRDSRRYLGIEELVDKKAGHIPTAVNYVWTEGFANGRFKAPFEQEKRFSNLSKDSKIIVYCGSGITATPNYIALKEAGFKHVKLYAGSFSDWISYDENEVETSDD